MKIALVDIETNGLDPRKNEILEIGAIVFESESLDVIDKMNIKVKMERPEDGDLRAYAVNGYKPEEWIDAVPIKQALIKMSRRVEGAIFCAYNVTFDWSFLDEASKRAGVPLGFHYHKICLMSLAFAKHRKVMTMKGCCIALGVPPEADVHRALNGALAEFEIFKALMK